MNVRKEDDPRRRRREGREPRRGEACAEPYCLGGGAHVSPRLLRPFPPCLLVKGVRSVSLPSSASLPVSWQGAGSSRARHGSGKVDKLDKKRDFGIPGSARMYHPEEAPNSHLFTVNRPVLKSFTA
ncbi:hypothetical protein E2C01_062616 [Portunus trituberculatus]|uniref:Uncharacterized protein n=1 Tax=Portunus trituberculatus TaxID=210409 RepID=A0A5B7HIJ1_PORTR|nr:hypothetical protein [Portunus trituberculatus]